MRRPAETAGGSAGLIAGAICVLLGVKDPNKIIAATVLVGFVPTVVTWLVVKLRASAG